MTGSDSAPAKANEAGQKNDIGAAKDDVSIYVQNALTDAYENAYVDGNSSRESASGDVGDAVITAVNGKYGTTQQIGLASIKSETKSDGDGEVTIWTTDFKVIGTIDKNGGILTWGEIVANDGTTPAGGQGNVDEGGPTIVGDIQPEIGDKVNYNPGTLTTANIDLPEGTEIEKMKLASLNLPAGTSIDGVIDASKSEDWRILDITDEGDVLIVPGKVDETPLTLQLNLDGYNNSVEAMDKIASIYNNPEYSKKARSITLEDFKKVVAYYQLLVHPWSKISLEDIIHEKTLEKKYKVDSISGKLSDIVSEDPISSTYQYVMEGEPYPDTDSYYREKICGKAYKSQFSFVRNFWIATRVVNVRGYWYWDFFGLMTTSNGLTLHKLCRYCEGNDFISDQILDEESATGLILPVVYLKGGIQMKKIGDTWELAEKFEEPEPEPETDISSSTSTEINDYESSSTSSY